MLKEETMEEINVVLEYFYPSSIGMSQTIHKRYGILKEMIKKGNIEYNPVKSSVRAYMDAFNDYENPVLDTMYNIESEIDLLILEKNKS